MACSLELTSLSPLSPTDKSGFLDFTCASDGFLSILEGTLPDDELISMAGVFFDDRRRFKHHGVKKSSCLKTGSSSVDKKKRSSPIILHSAVKLSTSYRHFLSTSRSRKVRAKVSASAYAPLLDIDFSMLELFFDTPGEEDTRPALPPL
jgi:hypothetical protein